MTLEPIHQVIYLVGAFIIWPVAVSILAKFMAKQDVQNEHAPGRFKTEDYFRAIVGGFITAALWPALIALGLPLGSLAYLAKQSYVSKRKKLENAI